MIDIASRVSVARVCVVVDEERALVTSSRHAERYATVTNLLRHRSHRARRTPRVLMARQDGSAGTLAAHSSHFSRNAGQNVHAMKGFRRRARDQKN